MPHVILLSFHLYLCAGFCLAKLSYISKWEGEELATDGQQNNSLTKAICEGKVITMESRSNLFPCQARVTGMGHVCNPSLSLVPPRKKCQMPE